MKKRSPIFWTVATVVEMLVACACASSSAPPTDAGLTTRPPRAAPAITAATATLPPAKVPTAAPAATLRPEVAAGAALPTSDEVATAVAQGVVAVQVPKQALDLDLAEDGSAPGCRSAADGFRDCGDQSANRMVFLFGDSKAGMWAPALDDFGKERGWRVVVQIRTSCTVPDFPLWSDTLKRRLTECDEFRSSVVDNIKRLRPDVVLMSSNFLGTMRTEKDGKPDELLGERPGGGNGMVIWRDGLSTMLGRVRDNAGRIVIVGNIPQRPSDPLDCLTAHQDDVRACNTRRIDAFDRNSQMQALTERTVAEQNGAVYVDTIRWFCTPSTCPETVGGFIVMRDRGHVSVQYSRWLRDVLANAAGILSTSAASVR